MSEDTESIKSEDPYIYLLSYLQNPCDCLVYTGHDNKHTNGGVNEALNDLFSNNPDILLS